MDRLRETDLYQDSIVVVTADHGVGLTPGGPRRLVTGDDEEVFADVLYPPLLIKGPGLEPGVTSDADAETIDIVPTLADLLGIDLPWSVDGISLRSTRREDDERTFFIEDGSATRSTPSPSGPTTTAARSWPATWTSSSETTIPATACMT